MKDQLDALDRGLIELLQQDGRLPVAELATRLGVSRPTVHSRLRNLKASGLLRVGGLVDAVAVEELTVALVGLAFREFDLEDKLNRIAALEQVSWAAVVTGRYDVICEVVTTGGMAGLYDFVNEGLKTVGGIRSTETFIVMKARDHWASVPSGTLRARPGAPGGRPARERGARVTADMIVSLAIFTVVLVLILTEKVHRTILSVAGACLMVGVGKIMGFYGEGEALLAIDFNVIGLLIGMMIVVGILAPTGFFEFLALWAGRLSHGSPFRLLILLGAVTAVLSMFLDNVTTIVVIAPITIVLCEMFAVSPAPFLLSEALFSNIGGAATLVGDPPNIIIGSAAGLSFNDFLIYSFPLMVVVWIAAAVMFRYLFRGELDIHPDRFAHVESLDPWKEIKDPVVARKVVIVFFGAIGLFVLHDALHMTPAFVALTAAGAALLWVRPDVHDTLQRVEWSVLVFFAGLFVMVGGLEASGLMELAAESLGALKDVDPVVVGIIVIWVAGLLSAVIDNIPITIAIIPVMAGLQKEGIDVWPLWWALAFGVGLGGNGTVIGASANVVVVSLSERTGTPITSAYWTRKGLPTMLLTLAVCSVLYAVAYYVLYT